MNEIVYNILRKCVECPEKISMETDSWFGDTVYRVFHEKDLLIKLYNDRGVVESFNWGLTDKECRRILRAMEHVEAMKIKNL